jgi:hypothetical protein
MGGKRTFKALRINAEVEAGDYVTLDARLGWKFVGNWGIFAEGENPSDRRDPVTKSGVGDAQFFRLPRRRILRR